MESKVNSWLALKYQIKVWEMFGLMPPPSDPIKRMLYILRAFFTNFFGIWSLCLIFFVKAFQAEDSLELLKYLYPPILVGLVAFKFLNSFNQRHKLLEMHYFFRKLDARVTSPEEIEIIEKAIKSAYKFFLFFVKNLSCSIFVCSLLVAIFATERILPFPAWYPWDFTKTRTIYIMTVALEVFSIVLICPIETVNSAYPQAYLGMITAHTKCLQLRVLRLGLPAINGSEKTKKEIYQDLTRCIYDHSTILQLYKEIRKILSLHCLSQLAVTAFVQCVIAFTIACKDVQDVSKIIQLIVVAITSTSETFILCYSCERFCKESQEFYQSIYSCNWTDQSIKFQKVILLFLYRAQEIQEMLAGNLIPLNYKTFLSVVRASYSLFAILNKSGER